jgi:MoaA/NifB/PqqE/SkfB family radical SAM enzyme
MEISPEQTHIFHLEGGEVLLRRESLLDIISGIKNNFPEQIIELLSNGSLMSKNVVSDLFEAGLSRGIVSLNSHIPEIHNPSRRASYDNCSHILSLPGETGKTFFVNSILDDFNIDSFPEFIHVLEDRGFKGMTISLNRGTIFSSMKKVFNRKKEVISFLFKILEGKYPFILNKTDNIKDFISFVLSGEVTDKDCPTPGRMIHVFINKNFSFCCGGWYRYCFEKLIPYKKGILKEAFTHGTKMYGRRHTLQSYCNSICRGSPQFFPV